MLVDLVDPSNVYPNIYRVSVSQAGKALESRYKTHYRITAQSEATYEVEVLPIADTDPFSEFMNKVYRVVMPSLGLSPYRLARPSSDGLELTIDRPVGDNELKSAVVDMVRKQPGPKDITVEVHEGEVSVSGTTSSNDLEQQLSRELTKIKGVETHSVKLKVTPTMNPQLNIVR